MTTRWTWMVAVLLGLMVLAAARQGWATCCKCSQCDSAVLCFTSGGDTSDCFETCNGINTCPCTDINTCPLTFSLPATCGEGEFSDCTQIDNIPVAAARRAAAPVLGSPTSPWFVLMTIALLVAGAVPLARRTRREG